MGDSVAELSSDWWGNPSDQSELRIVPVANSQQNSSDTASDETHDPRPERANLPQRQPRLHREHGVREPGRDRRCGDAPKGVSEGVQCTSWAQEIQVVDYSGGKIEKRGVVDLPRALGYGYYGGRVLRLLLVRLVQRR